MPVKMRRYLDAVLNDPSRDGVARKSSSVVDIELIHHLLAVFLNRLLTNAQMGRDLLVRHALSHKLQYLCFTQS